MKNTLTYLFLLCSLFAQAQEFTAALPHVDSVWRIPSNSGSRFQFHKIEGRLYVWNPNAASWSKVAQGVDVITGSIPPAYTPSYQQSNFAINAADSLYYYRGGAWRHLNPGGGGGGGTWGSITGTLSDQTDLQSALDAKTSDVLEGYGVDATYAGNDVTVKVDTTVIPTSFGAASVYRLWPKGDVNSYQAAITKRNWKIFYNNIQASSTRNAFVKFDTISSSAIQSTTNAFGNGIWMATSTGVADMLSGFSNNINHGGGFNLFGSGSINFSDWRTSGTRGSILKVLNWSDGGGDAAISFFKSYSSDVQNGLTKLPAGEEIGAIRFAAADTARALGPASAKNFQYPKPCSAIVGYVFKQPFNNAYYGGLGFWTTNGSTTQFRAMAIDSTISTTIRMGVNCIPTNANTLEVAGNVSLTTAGNKLKVATGTNASAGSTTLVGGTVTVSTTAVTSSSIVIVICKTPIVTQGILSVPAADIVNGTSFKINSSSVADASTVNWWIIN